MISFAACTRFHPTLFPPARFVLGVLAISTLASESLVGAELRVGRAKVVITPPIGCVMGNSYGVQVSTGVTSNIHAKAVVFEIDGDKAAIVACDLISLHRPIVEKTRALIAERTGVSPDRVILAATHCHAGPQTHPPLYNLGPESARKLSETYVEKLPGLMAESVRLAEADLQPAKISVGRGREESVSFNRRYLLRDGRVTMGARAADVVRRAGPIDPEVGVIYIESPNGTPLVTIVNFALHVAVVTGTKTSADYPHTLAETLGRVKGDAMLTVFLNGMSGNGSISYVPNEKAFPEGSYEVESARVAPGGGEILAVAASRLLTEMFPRP